jgi:hypothetical protein
MNRVVAIFDVDQTLVQGYTERFFFRYLVRRVCSACPGPWPTWARWPAGPGPGSRTKATSRGWPWRT